MIRVGIIGCGEWGRNHIRVFSEVSGVVVRTVCDRKTALSYPYRRKLGCKAVQNEDEVFRDSQIDAVVIATPASTHERLIQKAIKARKHLLVEKPLVDHFRAAQKIIRLAKGTRRVAMVAHTFVYNPAVEYLKRVVSRKDFGKVRYLYSTRTNLGPIRSDIDALWDLAPHDISIFEYILGSTPVRVRAVGGAYLKKKVRDVGFITLEYPRGVLGQIHVSWLDPNKVRRVTVVGEKKMALFDDIDPRNPICVYDKGVMKGRYERGYRDFREFQLIIRDGACRTPKIRKAEPLRQEILHFIECIRTAKIPRTGFMQGKNACKILELLERSIKQGGRPQRV